MLLDLLLGVALPLYVANVYQTIVGISIFCVILSILIVVGVMCYYFDTCDSEFNMTDMYNTKLKKFLIFIYAFNLLFAIFSPTEKFVQYTMYGIAGYNATTIIAETPIGQKAIQVASNGANKIVNASGQVFDSSLSNTLNLSTLLNTWIEKKSKELKMDMEKDLNGNEEKK